MSHLHFASIHFESDHDVYYILSCRTFAQEFQTDYFIFADATHLSSACFGIVTINLLFLFHTMRFQSQPVIIIVNNLRYVNKYYVSSIQH